MGKLRWVSFLIIFGLIGGILWEKSRAQTLAEEYFEETGHSVQSPFLQVFHSVPNPEELFGYPITDQFVDPSTNLIFQYFQKVRLELDPAYPHKGVQISNLGAFLYEIGGSGEDVDWNGASPCKTFPENGATVCYDFLRFFEEKGGVKQFGLPISNVERINKRNVQYFDKARFEWYPEYLPNESVIVSNLGLQYFQSRGEDQARLYPTRNLNTINGIRELQVRAFPLKAITSRQGIQTIYVIVHDQRLMPVTKSQVTLTIRLPSGDISRYIIPELTNERGITSLTIPYKSDVIGRAQIEVFATRENLSKKTLTSFRIWW